MFPATDSEVSCEFGSMKYYALCGFGGIPQLRPHTHGGRSPRPGQVPAYRSVSDRSLTPNHCVHEFGQSKSADGLEGL